MAEQVIELKNIKKSFNETPILNDISFSIPKGTKVSIIGPGGCGKTTVLKIILGLSPPEEGAVFLRGTDMANSSLAEKEKTLKKLGMAFQQGALFDYMTVKENLTFAMEHLTDMSKGEMDEKVDYLLQEVKLNNTHNLYPYELSGGMQRRVGIARALSSNPEIAIFDEPTAGLDPVTSTIILNMIHHMVEDKTSLIATSSVEIAIRYAERIIVLNEGFVAADGLWSELLTDGPEWVQHFLGTRLENIDRDYAIELGLPQKFIDKYHKKNK